MEFYAFGFVAIVSCVTSFDRISLARNIFLLFVDEMLIKRGKSENFLL